MTAAARTLPQSPLNTERKGTPVTELDTVFDFSCITDLHRARSRTIHDLLGGTAADLDRPAMAYAVAHHCLEGAEHAARADGRDRFGWYRSAITHPPATWFESTSRGPKIIQAPTRGYMHLSPIAETPYYLLGPETQPGPTELATLTSEALDIAAEHGFGRLVDNHAPIVCLLEAKNPDDTLNSWTISRLPGTVFLDHTDDPYILARDIIHEAGHNWLNDALAATSTTISDDATFYSPWKNTERPAFGFLHACLAFPLTMLFATTAATAAPKSSQQVLSTYLAQQRDKLATTTDSHHQALRLVTNGELQDRLRAIHAAAGMSLQTPAI